MSRALFPKIRQIRHGHFFDVTGIFSKNVTGTKKNVTGKKNTGFGGQKMFSDFLGVFLEMKFRWNKCAVFWNICEKLFLLEKNPTSSLKIVGILRKKIEIPIGSRHFC